MEGMKKIKPTLFHQCTWNSEVETTWISLIGWHHKNLIFNLHLVNIIQGPLQWFLYYSIQMVLKILMLFAAIFLKLSTDRSHYIKIFLQIYKLKTKAELFSKIDTYRCCNSFRLGMKFNSSFGDNTKSSFTSNHNICQIVASCRLFRPFIVSSSV